MNNNYSLELFANYGERTKNINCSYEKIQHQTTKFPILAHNFRILLDRTFSRY